MEFEFGVETVIWVEKIMVWVVLIIWLDEISDLELVSRATCGYHLDFLIVEFRVCFKNGWYW
jgi:hypothetical protein